MFEYEATSDDEEPSRPKKTRRRAKKPVASSREVAAASQRPARKGRKTKPPQASSHKNKEKENQEEEKEKSAQPSRKKQKLPSSQASKQQAESARQSSGRTMLVTPSPLKTLAVSPIKMDQGRNLNKAFQSPSVAQQQGAHSIFTPASERPTKQPAKQEPVQPVSMHDVQELSAKQPEPVERTAAREQQEQQSSPQGSIVVDSKRYGRRNSPGESHSESGSESSETMDLKALEPFFRTGKPKKKPPTAEELARQEALEERQKETDHAIKDFYEKIDAEPLDEFFDFEEEEE